MAPGPSLTFLSDENLSRPPKALGADETINYRTTPDWDEEVFRLTDKAGADHVVEVGGTNTFPKLAAFTGRQFTGARGWRCERFHQ